MYVPSPGMFHYWAWYELRCNNLYHHLPYFGLLMIKKKSREIDNVRKSKDDFNVHKSFSPIVQRKIGLANGEEFLKSHLDYLLGKCTEVMGQWRVDCPRKSGFFSYLIVHIVQCHSMLTNI